MDNNTDVKKRKNFKLSKKENELDVKELLKPTKGDVSHSLAKGAISLIPGAGGILGEIFNLGVPSPMTKRMIAFLVWFDKRLKALEKQGLLSIEQLQMNDEFLDVVIQATQIAVRNHSQPLKIEALRGAVINTALKINIDSDAKFMYLDYIDSLTEIQLHILQILQNPRETIEQIYHMNKGNKGEITYIDVVSDMKKILKVEKIFFDAAIRRLETDYLIDQTDKPPGPPKGGYYEEKIHPYQLDDLVGRTQSIITDYGKKFLTFITEH